LIYGALDVFRYFKAHFLGLKAMGSYRPDIIHGHVLTREILFAFYLSRKWERPYLISEHWSRYFSENGTYRGWIRKRITRFLVMRSEGVIAVSSSLKKAMLGHNLSHEHFFIVPSLVDISAYTPPEIRNFQGKATILHVSCFEDKSKNISGFLDAVAIAFSSRTDFIVLLAGEGPDLESMKKYALSLGLGPDKVRFNGLRQNKDLINLYQTSSFLVQSSRYETFGTVIVEALSCGLPVISSKTGIAAEIIDRKSGILLQHPGTGEMAAAIINMLDIYTTFDPQKLHDLISGSFSELAVTEKLAGIYSQTISEWQTA
jgi:glycosyltransferase involved in cell wall biosynthesis